MEEELEQYREACINLCKRLLYAVEKNREDAEWIFSDEIYKAYAAVNDMLAAEIRETRRKIAKL